MTTLVDQFLATEHLWASRFGREPTDAEVARMTGAYLGDVRDVRLLVEDARRRVEASRAGEGARRPSKASEPVGRGDPVYGACRDCGGDLVRVVGRTGRPPVRCDACRGLA